MGTSVINSTLSPLNLDYICWSVVHYQRISLIAEPIWFSYSMWILVGLVVRFLTILGEGTTALQREIATIKEDPSNKISSLFSLKLKIWRDLSVCPSVCLSVCPSVKNWKKHDFPSSYTRLNMLNILHIFTKLIS